jgi:A/G-specific adenine glycosylase
LLAWYDDNKRVLPWRENREPYRVWVSEIMLQQTRVEAAIGHYKACLAAFPTVEALAGAPLESVYKAWEGLGYYSRARRLREAAAIVTREGFPETYDGWRKLPGVGEYTAAAIASICLGEPVCAVDGNVLRVMARYVGIREAIEMPSSKRRAGSAAGALLDRARPGDFNQALMELGATVCVPRQPRCAACPLAASCDARACGDAADLPIRSPKKGKIVERLRVAVILCGDAVLLRKRAEEGLLGGQWEFPHDIGADTLSSLDAEWVADLPSAKHIFTHRIWEMDGALYKTAARVDVGGNYRWATRAEMEALPIPSAMSAWRKVAMEALP